MLLANGIEKRHDLAREAHRRLMQRASLLEFIQPPQAGDAAVADDAHRVEHRRRDLTQDDRHRIAPSFDDGDDLTFLESDSPSLNTQPGGNNRLKIVVSRSLSEICLSLRSGLELSAWRTPGTERWWMQGYETPEHDEPVGGREGKAVAPS